MWNKTGSKQQNWQLTPSNKTLDNSCFRVDKINYSKIC